MWSTIIKKKIENEIKWPRCWIIDDDIKAAVINIFKDAKGKVNIMSERWRFSTENYKL